VLEWLPWSERVRLFDQLLALQPPSEGRAQAVAIFAAASDARAAPRLWQLLDEGGVTPSIADTVRDSLKRVYWGDSVHRAYYSSGVRERDTDRERRDAQVVKEVTPLVARAPRWKRIVAMTLIAEASSEEAARLASDLWKDPQADPQIRGDALQFLLLN